MVNLPGYAYVLGMLPLLALLSTLRLVDAGIRTFVWGTSHPCLAYSKLPARCMIGCLGLPSVEHFALALHLSQVACMLPGLSDPPQWVRMEQQLMSCQQGLSILYQGGRPLSHPENPMLQAMRKSWQRAHRLLAVDSLLNLNGPLWDNDCIPM